MRMVTELTRQATQFHEMRLELGRLATTTSQAEERARVAEEKASAAATVGMLRGVLGRGRDVLESGTRFSGETDAGMGCRLPRPGFRERVMWKGVILRMGILSIATWRRLDHFSTKCAEVAPESSSKQY